MVSERKVKEPFERLGLCWAIALELNMKVKVKVKVIVTIKKLMQKKGW